MCLGEVVQQLLRPVVCNILHFTGIYFKLYKFYSDFPYFSSNEVIQELNIYVKEAAKQNRY